MPYVTSSKSIDDMPIFPGVLGSFSPGVSQYVHESVRHFYVGNPDFTISETGPGGGASANALELAPTGITKGGAALTTSEIDQFNKGIGNYRVSARNYGAVLDGVTDDTASIQAAIDSGAKVVWLDGPVAMTTASIRLGEGQTLCGIGMEATIINFRPSGAGVCIRNKAGAAWTTVTNLQINSASNVNYAFQFTSSYANHVKGVRLSGVFDIGALYHGTYVCDIDGLWTNGCKFKKMAVAVSSSSNAFSIRRLYTSGAPESASDFYVGVAIEGGSGHSIDDCCFQGQTIGISLATPTSTKITNPYFEDVVCAMRLGDPTRPSTSKSTTVIGGLFTTSYASHPQHSLRGPVVYLPRAEKVKFVGPHFQVTNNTAAATGPYNLLFAQTTGDVEIELPFHYGGAAWDIVNREVSGASPSVMLSGSSYGSFGAKELILKADGAWSGASAAIRVDSAGVVTGVAKTIPIMTGAVNAMLTQAMPAISTLVMP